VVGGMQKVQDQVADREEPKGLARCYRLHHAASIKRACVPILPDQR
jgi:hypothetical protein